MAISLRVDGFRELERVLAEELPKATAKNVLNRTATNAMKRIKNRMAELAPREEGTLSESMKTQRVKATRLPGGRYARSTGAAVMTGPAPENKMDQFNASWQEFGTVNMPASPYARPAADSEGRAVIAEVKDELTAQVMKAKEKIARKAARGG